MSAPLVRSRYRYVVVPSRIWQYAVLDRATERIVADELLRAAARALVKSKNKALTETSP